MTRAVGGIIHWSFARAKRLTTGCSETALLTTVSTAGTKPASADIMKLVEPWQWITALISVTPVSSTTFRTAAGWAYSPASSSVQWLAGTSIDARQFSSQTTYPSATRTASRL